MESVWANNFDCFGSKKAIKLLLTRCKKAIIIIIVCVVWIIIIHNHILLAVMVQNRYCKSLEALFQGITASASSLFKLKKKKNVGKVQCALLNLVFKKDLKLT